MRKLIAVSVLVSVGALLFSMPEAAACHDNWDKVIAKLQELDLTKVQLDRIFGMQKDLARLRAEDHSKGFACSHHEVHVKAYEQTAIGLLDDGQFKKYTGRERTEIEKLRKEVRELREEVAALRKAIQEIREALKK